MQANETHSQRRYYSNVLNHTGALYQQPSLRTEDYEFTYGTTINAIRAIEPIADYSVLVDLRQALDAPDDVPAGSVRAMDIGEITIGVAHTKRAA